MIRTFDFIWTIQRDIKLKEKIYEFIQSEYDEEMDIQGWHLLFEGKRRWVTVTSNGTDKYLEVKFRPAEIEYDSLISLIEREQTEEPLQIRFLE